LTPLSGAQQLILGSTPDRHYLATYSGSGLDAEIIARQGLFSVAFVCPDPFAYAINPDVVMITASPHTHTQRGTAPAEPLLRLQGASTGAGGQQISITVGGQTVTYRGVLAAGDWLEIDSRDMTAVRVVGASRVNALPGFDPISIFPVLTPGTNIVVVSVAGGATWSLLEMYCRNRWL
jgi:phage-related protein